MPPTRSESPPKRMTRARAKAVEETKKAPARSTKATASTTAKTTATAAPKRKTRTDDEEDHSKAENSSNSAVNRSKSETSKEPAKTIRSSGPVRKPAYEPSAATNTTTTRLATTSSAAKSVAKRTKAATTTPAANAEESKSSEPPARSTRARTGSVTRNTMTQGPANAKKRVAFKDVDSDKENLPAEASKKPAKPTQRAQHSKPQEKAAAVKPRSAKAEPSKSADAKERTKTTSIAASRLEPLSPRKNVQLSRPSSSGNSSVHGSEETFGTPVSQPGRSQIRIMTPSARQALTSTPTVNRAQPANPLEPMQNESEDLDVSIDELQHPTAIFTSPTKASISLMTSPPKRPTASPFKDSLKESPRKFVHASQKTTDQVTKISSVDSVLSKPAKRVPLSEPRQKPALDPSKSSQSKNLLLQSPAKRPLSPSKGLSSAIKAPATTSSVRVMNTSMLQQTPSRYLFSPTKTITSALRAVKSPHASAKVHKMTTEEQTKMFEDELAAAPSPCSPVKWIQHPMDEQSKAMAISDTQWTSTDPPSKSPLSPLALSSPQTETEIQNQPPRSLGAVDPTLCPSPQDNNNISMLEAVDEAAVNSESQPYFEFHTEDFLLEDMGSEDELQVGNSEIHSPPPVKTTQQTSRDQQPTTPRAQDMVKGTVDEQPAVSMTALAERFGGWQGATPDDVVLQKRKEERSMFTPLHPIVDGLQGLPASPSVISVADTTELDDSIAILEDEDELMVDSSPLTHHNKDTLRRSQISEASQDYGDENEMPIDPSLLASAVPVTATCTPARVFEARPKIVHTVCKVPLKPAASGDESPRPNTGRRAYSLMGELSVNSAFELEGLRQINPPATHVTVQNSVSTSTHERISKFIENLGEDEIQATPSSKTETWSTAVATPARTPRPGLNTKLLSGAVVFVDVHTSEGADASELFIELLQQMGAKCVKQWSWDSRKSLGNENTAGDLAAFGSTRVGITHVVFKDGGKRTMEKVREAKGLVYCVGVGWVLACEKENKWLDEADYAIDVSTIPRGGYRRRKSMEPKALSSATFKPVQISPTKEFLNLTSPPSRRATICLPSASQRQSMLDSSDGTETAAAESPTREAILDYGSRVQTPLHEKRYDPSVLNSPATPYFLHPDQLIQHTCPPKQTQQVLFPLSGRIEDEPDEKLRQRLLLARRKSLQFAPKVGSPLSRAHSFQ